MNLNFVWSLNCIGVTFGGFILSHRVFRCILCSTQSITTCRSCDRSSAARIACLTHSVLPLGQQLGPLSITILTWNASQNLGIL